MDDSALTLQDIDLKYRQHVSTQTYGQAPQIHGVVLTEVRVSSDDGGAFAEIARINDHGFVDAFPDFHASQLSFSSMHPGTVKAFHLHFKQDDLWFVPPHNRVVIGLVDVREVSPTCGLSMRLALGAGKAYLLRIPKGVAHGVANPGPAAAAVFYLVSQQFQADDPDEHRLPHDLLGADFWDVTPG